MSALVPPPAALPPLWPHQERAVPLAEQAVRSGHRAVLVTTPTGGGKSRVIAELARRARDKGRTVAVFTHRKILTRQASDVLDRQGLDVGVVAAGYPADLMRGVQLVSLPTVAARVFRSGRQELPDADLVMVDEAHSNKASTASRVIRHYLDRGAVVIGFTATPVGLKDLYSALVVAGTPSELRRCGSLVPCTVFAPDEPDLRGIRQAPSGEFVAEQAARRAMETLVIGNVFEAWERLNPWRLPTLLWAPGVAESRWFAEQFRARGVGATHLDGETPEAERAAIFAGSADGSIPLVSSCGVLREGADLPWVRHGILVQPCGALSTYLQCLDQHTDVLTRRGFLGPDEIRDDDLVAALDASSGETFWQPIISRVDRHLAPDEGMFILRGPSVNLRVTAGHRMAHKKRTTGPGKRCRWPDRWSFLEAASLAETRSCYRLPVSGHQSAHGVPLTDDQLRFVGWFLTDGTLNRSNRQVVITQAVHQPQIHALRDCLVSCGFDFTEYPLTPNGFPNGQDQIRFSVPKGGRTGSLARNGWGSLSPYLDKDFSPLLDDVNERQLAVLLEAIHLGDGAKQLGQGWVRRSYHIATANLTFANRLQSLCVRRGYRANLASKLQNNSVLYILHIKKTDFITVGGSAYNDHSRLRSAETSYLERVWCVENALGTLFIRRHGKVAIVGNCVGRLLRSHPGKDRAVLQDHAGAWWRHGSPNADRDWSLDDDDRSLAKRSHRAQQEGRERQPVCCPRCAGVRAAGPECPHCGFRHVRSVRHVRMVGGSLVRMVGDVVKRKKQATGEQKAWMACLYAAHHSGHTLAQAAHDYRRRAGGPLPGTLQYVPPAGSLDWHRRPAEVYPWLAKRRAAR